MIGHRRHRRFGIALAQRGQQAAARLDGEIVALAAGGVGEVAHHLHGGAHQHLHHGVARAARQDVVELDLDVDLLLEAPGLDQPLGLVDVGGQRIEVFSVARAQAMRTTVEASHSRASVSSSSDTLPSW